MKKYLVLILTALMATGPMTPLFAQAPGDSSLSRVAGVFVARNYNFIASVVQGVQASGLQTLVVTNPQALKDGRVIIPYAVNAPVSVDGEIETPTTVSQTSCPSGGNVPEGCTAITATWTAVHGGGQNNVSSGTFGLQEAINDAAGFVNGAATGSGGTVVVSDPAITDIILSAASPFQRVAIEDNRRGQKQIWNITPATTTVLGLPTAPTAQAACDATHQFCSDSTVAGSASWGSTVHLAISCVDVMGEESLASADVSFTSVASKAIDIGNPVAVTGCVGWKPYLSLSGGTYALAYSVPLLTQPTTLLAIPVSASVCQLTTLETTTPACKITNAVYGQVASTTGANGTFLGGAQFTGYPVVTSQLAPNLNSASAQSLNASNGGIQTYKYVPGMHVGLPGVVSNFMSFPITTAAQSTIGQVAGSINMPPNFMNFVGKTIEVCGMLSKTNTTADTITNIQLWWDAEGSNVTTGQPIELSNIQITATLTAAASVPFCQDITTTVAATTATGGTITPGEGYLTEAQVSAGTIHFASSNILFAAVASLNLALNARLDVVYNHTTGTDGAGVVLINPTVKVLN